jgi:hypothetical protein
MHTIAADGGDGQKEQNVWAPLAGLSGDLFGKLIIP